MFEDVLGIDMKLGLSVPTSRNLVGAIGRKFEGENVGRLVCVKRKKYRKCFGRLFLGGIDCATKGDWGHDKIRIQ